MATLNSAVVIPTDMYYKMQFQQGVTQRHSSALERDLQNIMNSNESADLKNLKYIQTFNRYMHSANQLRQPIEIPTMNENVPGEDVESKPDEIDQLIQDILPDTRGLRKKASDIITWLKRTDSDFNIDDRGVITHQNVEIGDLADFIPYAVNLKKRKVPENWSKFQEILMSKVPKNLIPRFNVKRKETSPFSAEEGAAGSSTSLSSAAEPRRRVLAPRKRNIINEISVPYARKKAK